MSISEAIRVVHFSVGLLFAWALFYMCHRAYLLDNFRQTLFEIRDDLFDLAADAEIAFDDYSYRALRDELNSLIFFADKMSFIRIAFTPMPANPYERQRKWLESVTKYSPLVRRALLAMHERTMYETMDYIIQRSLTLLIFASATRLAGLWIEAARTLFNKFSTFTHRVEAQALDEYRSAA
jgi:hypothetical protein